MKLSLKIQDWLNSQEQEKKEKTSFWATEAETPVFDLYHKWIGTEVTNEISAEKTMMFNAAKMMELSLVETLDNMGLLKMPEDEQWRIEGEREGVPVSGYVDAVFKDGSPLEIKSFYGYYQIADLKAGKPKESYLKQLAIYMDFMDADKGVLIYIERGTGEMFEFILERVEGLKFRCNDIEFDLSDTYKRWARLYKNNIIPGVEPKSEYRYKIPIEEIDWKTISNADISKARNGRKVISDHWSVQYSPYKDLIIEREGTGLGYTKEELAKIKELTKGYSTKS